MKKGFTLVELLAVVIILGILAVVIVPKIQQTLKESKKNTYEASAIALEREADVFYTHQKIKQEQFSGCEYNFTTNNNTCNGFEFKGQKPDSGGIKIYSNGETAYSLKFDDYWYTKRLKSDNISISEQGNENILIIPEIVTSGDGLYQAQGEEGRLIYRGANPDNYINLTEDGVNNTLYRIISYETDGTIKVVRNEKLDTNMSWDDTRTSDGINDTYCTGREGCNVWGNQESTLFKGTPLGDNFHYEYYDSPSAQTLSQGEFGKVGNSTKKEAQLNMYLNNGDWEPKNVLDKYIDVHKFSVGGIWYYYDYELGGKGIEKEKEEERLYTWTGKIGLMNITEYVEASTYTECEDMYSAYEYSYPKYYRCCSVGYGGRDEKYRVWPEGDYACAPSNWASKDYVQWSMTPFSYGKTGVWYFNNGLINNNVSTVSNAVRPAFYLKSSVVLAGSGTETDPFYIIEN